MATLHKLPRPAPPETDARRPGLLVDVAVLTTDSGLFETVRRAVGEQNPVWRAGSAEETVDLLLSGRCGVLLVDMASTAAAAALIEQIKDQFPDVVTVVAGRRDDETSLGRLVSEGLVYRFMHKPLTPKRAGMFLNAAIRRHVEIRDPQRARLIPADPAAPRRGEAAKWAFVAGGVLLCAGLLWALSGRHRDTVGAPPAASTPTAAPAADTGSAVRADPVLSSARAAFEAGRYESPPGRNALDLYHAVLLARPDATEARDGLGRTVALLAEQARIAHARGDADEAHRLLDRLLGVAAADPVVTALQQQLAPPPPAVVAPAPAAVAPAEPPPRPAADAAARPTPLQASDDPPSAARVASPPPASPPPRPVRAVRDPLLPVAATPLPQRRTSSGGSARARAYGAPISTGHAIAGMEGAPSSEQAPGAAGAGTARLHTVALDQLERLEVVDPVYPPAALQAGVQGRVEVAFTVSESGTVRDASVVEAAPQGVFDAAAVQAIERWRFRPRAVNGAPVAVRTTATLRFEVQR